LKLLDGAIKRHFDIDVEVARRLRCCYAWADKKHQDGNVQSVLVENSDSGASGISIISIISSTSSTTLLVLLIILVLVLAVVLLLFII
jgi:hypothetical protein